MTVGRNNTQDPDDTIGNFNRKTQT